MSLHTLVVAEVEGVRTFTVDCPGVTKDCAASEPCKVADCDDSEADSLDDVEVHGQMHTYLDDPDVWFVVTDRCFFAGQVDAAQILTGHDPLRGEQLLPGGYPVDCSAPDPYEGEARSMFYVVDHPASIYKSAETVRRERELTS